MVDLQTAMAAAAAERKQRSGAASQERKVRRSGADLGIEAFDPVKHVKKEKADTASMWLVLSLCCSCFFGNAVRIDAKYISRKIRYFVFDAIMCHYFNSPST